MLAFSKARLSGPVGAVKGSLRRASPALDRAHRTLLSSPDPLEFQKEAARVNNMRIMLEVEWYFVRIPRKKYHFVIESMSVSGLVEYIWVTNCHILDNKISFIYLII
jgi:hypothetical protein